MKTLNSDRNLYTASEYLKMRPAVGGGAVARFQTNNNSWTSSLFGNAALPVVPVLEQNSVL